MKLGIQGRISIVFTLHLRVRSGGDRVAENIQLHLAYRAWFTHDDPPHNLREGVRSACSRYISARLNGKAGGTAGMLAVPCFTQTEASVHGLLGVEHSPLNYCRPSFLARSP